MGVISFVLHPMGHPVKSLVKVSVLVASLVLLYWGVSTPDTPEPVALAEPAVAAPVAPAEARGAVPGNQDPEPFYVVAEYDEGRDPAVDLESAVARASEDGKRILVEVGGQWCGWCKRLDLFIHDHSAIAQRLEEDFLIMKVNFSQENENEEFLAQYPAIRGYPHIFVLESDGTFLHSQNTGDLEEGSSYNEGAILTFLDAWTPGGA